MVIFVSDLHLRSGAHTHLAREAQFKRFWQRVEQSRRGAPATLCFVGDLFDLVRAPEWLEGDTRPYHPESPELAADIEKLVDQTLTLEKDFFSAIRQKVTEGALRVEYVLGNHDRLLNLAPAARAKVRAALGMEGGEAPLPTEARFPEAGVLAYHGHVVDAICHDPSGGASLSDLICPELIVRFPIEIRNALGFDHPRLDDIDDVRPVVAVPAWVRSLARTETKKVAEKISKVWARLIEEFLENRAVKDWFKENHKRFRFDFAQKMRLLLALSAKKGLSEDAKFVALHDVMFRIHDVKFARAAVRELQREENRGLCYAINGHTHFAAMTPLGRIGERPGCYFNIGTWRTVHQLGNVARDRPAFLGYDAMAYLVFFDPGDPLGRELEWWQGAAVGR
ncbi:MAG: metallophosphoesterase [Myxococcota bacterium]